MMEVSSSSDLSIEALANRLCLLNAELSSSTQRTRNAAVKELYDIVTTRENDLYTIFVERMGIELQQLLNSMFRVVTKHCDNILGASNARTKSVMINKNPDYMRIVDTLAEMSYRNKRNAVPAADFLTNMLSLLNKDEHCEYFGTCYLQVVEGFIVRSSHVLQAITYEMWQNLLTCVFRLWTNKQANHISVTTILVAVKTIVTYGPRHVPLDLNFHTYLPKVAEMLEEIGQGRNFNTLLNIIYIMSAGSVLDHADAVGKFLETSMPELVDQFDVHLEKSSKMHYFKIYQLFLLLRKKYSYGLVYEARSFLDIIVREIAYEKLQRDDKDFMCPILIDIGAHVAEMAFLVNENDVVEVNGDGEEALVRAPKRIRNSPKLERLIDYVKPTDNTFCWRWFAIMTESLSQYDENFSENDCSPLLQLLKDYQPTISYPIEMKMFEKCCLVALHQMKRLGIKNNKYWEKMAQTAFQCAATSSSLSSEYKSLLTALIAANVAIPEPMIRSIIETFTCDPKLKDISTIQLLTTIYQHFNVSNMPESKEIVAQTISWAWPNDKDYDPNANCILKRSVPIHALSQLITQCLIIYKDDFSFMPITVTPTRFATPVVPSTNDIDALDLKLEFKIKLAPLYKNAKNLPKSIPPKYNFNLNETHLEHLAQIVNAHNQADGQQTLPYCVRHLNILVHIFSLVIEYCALDDEQITKSFFFKHIELKLQLIEIIFNPPDIENRFNKVELNSALVVLRSVFAGTVHRKVGIILRRHNLRGLMDYLDSFEVTAARLQTYQCGDNSVAEVLLSNIIKFMSVYIQQEGASFAKAFDYVERATTILEMHIAPHVNLIQDVLMLIMAGNSSTNIAAELVLDTLKDICKDHHRDYKRCNWILDNLPAIIEFIAPYPDLKCRKLMKSFVEMAKSQKYGIERITKVIFCVKCYFKANDFLFQENNSITDFLPYADYFKIPSVAIHLAFNDCLGGIYQRAIPLDNAPDKVIWFQNLFIKIHNAVMTFLQQYDSERNNTPDEESYVVSLGAHFYEAVICNSEMCRATSLSSYITFGYLVNLTNDAHKVITDISEHLKVGILDLFTDYIDEILVQWLHVLSFNHITDFPTKLLGYEQLPSFCRKYKENIAFWSMVNNDDSFQIFKNELHDTNNDILKAIAPKVVAYLVPLRSNCTQLSRAYKTTAEKIKLTAITLGINMALVDQDLLEIIDHLFANFFDLDAFTETYDFELEFPHTRTFSISKSDLDLCIDHCINTFERCVFNDAHSTQKLLNNIKTRIQKAHFSLKKIMHLQQYGFALKFVYESLVERLKDNAVLYVLRDVCHFLCSIIGSKSASLEEHVVAITILEEFCTKAMATRLCDKFESLIYLIVSCLTPVVCGELKVMSEKASNVLNLIFIEHSERFKTQIMVLDDFPSDEVFKDLGKAHHDVKYQNDTLAINLADEMDYFSRIDDCNVVGLTGLQQHIVSQKDQLAEIYARLQKNENTKTEIMSQDNRLIHKLYSKLFTHVLGTNLDKSVEATKCLGEFGAADLKTLSLPIDSKWNRCTKVNEFENVVHKIYAVSIEFFRNLIVHTDMDIQNAVSKACYMIAGDSTNGLPLLKADKFLAIFVGGRSCRKELFETPEKLKSLNFKQLLRTHHVSSYDDWIKKLTMAILSNLGDKIFIDVIKLHVPYAEAIMPYLIGYILTESDISVVKKLCEMINNFFTAHNTKMLNKKSLIYFNKDVIKSMIQIVECIRINNQTSTRKDPDLLPALNFLDIAKAAEFCEAHFHVILYCELHSDSQKTEDNTKIPTSVHELMKKAYIALDQNHEAAVFVDPTNMESDMILFESDHTNHNLGILLSASAAAPFQNNQCESLFMEIMLNKGLLQFTGQDLLNKLDKNYEHAWRMGQWERIKETPIQSPSQCFEKNHYNALKCLKEKDQAGVSSSILEARKAIVNILKHTSLECTHNVYKQMVRLQLLQQVEDFSEVQFRTTEAAATNLLKKWEINDQLPCNEFKYREPVLSQRIVLFSLAGIRAKRSIASDAVSFEDVQSQCILNLANKCIAEGYYEKAYQQVLQLKSLESSRTIADKVNLMAAKVNIKLNQLNLAKTYLRAIKQSQSFEIVEAFIMYGDISAECSLESSEHYYMQAKEVLQKIEPDSQGVAAHQEQLDNIYRSIATFADRQFMQTNALKKTDEFSKKVKNVEKYKQNAIELKKKIGATREEKQMYVTLEKSAKNDEHEIRTVNEAYGKYLQMALDYYLKMSASGDTLPTTMFRIIFLWFIEEDDVTHILKTNWRNIPSWKFLTIVPQITARLGTVNNNSNRLILEILERCAIDHPHHVLPHIFAIKNAHMDEPDEQPKNLELRVQLAKKLCTKLQSVESLSEIINQMDNLWLKLIQLANKPINKVNSNEPIMKLRNLDKVQCLTIELPISHNAVYNKITSITKYDTFVGNVGGINAPKKVKCICSDGNVYNQLVKGRDDLRQDAVMQQVFRIMNDLFGQNKGTRNDNLKIRTYKVTPLSQRSGVLEWCDNTCPLSEYLIGTPTKPGAHRRFMPNDMLPNKCREAMSANKAKPSETKLQLYKTMLTKISPVFHHFFYENYLQPCTWFEKRMAYTKSVATTSMVGFILGIGDRHLSNILIDKTTAEVIHIDFGIAFEQGKCLPTTETVPFRLTRDIVAGFGATGENGQFRKSCVDTLQVLRDNKTTITSILELLLYDPLYAWTMTNKKAFSRQDMAVVENEEEENESRNITAERALLRVIAKLEGRQEGIAGVLATDNQVEWLIAQATSVLNLYRLFEGWQPYL